MTLATKTCLNKAHFIFFFQVAIFGIAIGTLLGWPFFAILGYETGLNLILFTFQNTSHKSTIYVLDFYVFPFLSLCRRLNILFSLYFRLPIAFDIIFRQGNLWKFILWSGAIFLAIMVQFDNILFYPLSLYLLDTSIKVWMNFNVCPDQ